jgi:hypothetical protein
MNRLDGTYSIPKCYEQSLALLGEIAKTNKELYGELSSINSVLQERRLKFIGHMWRRKEEIVSQMLLWEPKQGPRKMRRPARTYVDQLREDTELTTIFIQLDPGSI